MSGITFESYQERLLTIEESFDVTFSDKLYIFSLGLTGEAGEVANIIKKLIRDDEISEEALKKELGDVLAYLTLLAVYFEFDLKDIAASNITKLEQRRERGTLQGSGDDR